MRGPFPEHRIYGAVRVGLSVVPSKCLWGEECRRPSRILAVCRRICYVTSVEPVDFGLPQSDRIGMSYVPMRSLSKYRRSYPPSLDLAAALPRSFEMRSFL